MSDKQKLLELLKEHAVIHHPDGDFKLHSGGTSEWEFDIPRSLCSGDIVDYLTICLHDIIGSGSMLVGMEFGGALIVAAINESWWCDSAYYRKDGTIIIGNIEEGYVLIDDVITTGGSIAQAIYEIKKETGKSPKMVISIVDRLDGTWVGGRFRYIPLFKMSDFNLEDSA